MTYLHTVHHAATSLYIRSFPFPELSRMGSFWMEACRAPHMQSHLSQDEGETPWCPPSLFLQVIDELEKSLESKIAECFGWKQGCQTYSTHLLLWELVHYFPRTSSKRSFLKLITQTCHHGYCISVHSNHMRTSRVHNHIKRAQWKTWRCLEFSPSFHHQATFQDYLH